MGCAADIYPRLAWSLGHLGLDGSLDTTFSEDEKVTTDFFSNVGQPLAVAIQTNGRIVAAGVTFVPRSDDFARARYTCLRRTSRPMSIPIRP